MMMMKGKAKMKGKGGQAGRGGMMKDGEEGMVCPMIRAMKGEKTKTGMKAKMKAKMHKKHGHDDGRSNHEHAR